MKSAVEELVELETLATMVASDTTLAKIGYPLHKTFCEDNLGGKDCSKTLSQLQTRRQAALGSWCGAWLANLGAPTRSPGRLCSPHPSNQNMPITPFSKALPVKCC
jgi:hypothetical protein